MEELRELFERETGKTFHVYEKGKYGRPLVVSNACSVSYAEWLEEKLKAPNSEYKQCEHDFKWSSVSKYGTCKKCGERMHG